jgi:group I intron endonuclease
MWENKINGKRYIGSSENLKRRFSEYFNINYLLNNNSMYICNSLNKHGYTNFFLIILKYCSPDKCLIREKHFWDIFKPEYNISQDPTAPMSGRKHSDKTKQIMSDAKKGTTLSDKTKKIMSDAKKGSNHPNYGKTLSDKTKTKISDALVENTNKKGKPRTEGAGRPSQQIEVIDSKNNTTTTYDSIREAARALNLPNHCIISNYIKNNQQKPYKGQYTFRYLKK